MTIISSSEAAAFRFAGALLQPGLRLPDAEEPADVRRRGGGRPAAALLSDGAVDAPGVVAATGSLGDSLAGYETTGSDENIVMLVGPHGEHARKMRLVGAA
ncbi:hypothetical protein [Actinomadura coerulea]|uniref:hypothetical protein n=1 Tax=Actinomadura coerulea TaxID=46159 RepID=UPI00341D02FF